MSKQEVAQQDPVDTLAREIVARWDRDEDDKKFARARSLARRQVSAEARAAHDAVPANWIHRMRKAGVVGLAQTWEGAPCSPDLCIARRGLWSIDAEGIWVQPESQARQFVATPVVETPNAGPFAALVKGQWVTSARPAVEGRPTARAYAERALRALVDAGVKFGPAVVTGDRPDNLDRQPAARYVAMWLLGVDPVADSIGNSPVRHLTGIHPDDDRPATAEGRQRLGEVLGRMPADIHRR